MPNDSLLAQGIAAVKTGNMAKANQVLAEVIRDDPCSEQGWLWLGRARNTPEERAYCFKKVLSLNPVNLEAREELRGGLSAEPVAPAGLQAGPCEPLPDITPAPVLRLTKRRFNRFWLLGGLAGIMFLFLVVEGVWVFTRSQANAVPEVTVMATLPPPPTPVPPSATPQPTATNLFPPEWTRPAAATAVPPQAGPTPTISAKALATAQALINQANQAVQAGDYKKAMPLLDQALIAAPHLGPTYFLRAAVGVSLSSAEPADPSIRPELYGYLADINQAMVFGNPNGDYYAVRYALEEVLAVVSPYRVDQDFWNDQSLPDLEQAVQLGNTIKNSEQDMPLVLAKLGRCQEALDYANQLLKTKPQSPAGIYEGLAAGDLCAKDPQTALKHIETALKSESTSLRQLDRAEILYSLGRYADARAQFDAVFKAKKVDLSVCWYAWRALLDAKLGDWASVQGDLTTAGRSIPPTGGVDAYARGLAAQSLGDKAGALRYFQDAEAKLIRTDGPILLAEIQQQLAQAGGAPLAPTMSAPATPTPRP